MVAVRTHLRKGRVVNGHYRRGKIGTKRVKPFYHTSYLQDNKTGYMEGRERVRGKGDGTRVYMESNRSRIMGRAKSK